MKTGKLVRALLRALAVPAVLAVFVILDWYPTVKDLGRLRYERRDLERKIKSYGDIAGNFKFPDAAEDSLLADTEAELCRVLPLVENDDAWTAISIFDMQSRMRQGRVPYARFLFRWQIDGLGLETAAAASSDSLTHWIGEQFGGIQEGFSMVHDPGNFPWRDVLIRKESCRCRLASRPICVAALAPLPVLLGLINRLSWGEARLEIVRLRLEPGVPLAKAWLVCRGNYRVTAPSRWLVKMEHEKDAGILLVDSDSPLLLQKVDPLLAPRIEKRDLPPAGSPW
jgi:hypothetical protein